MAFKLKSGNKPGFKKMGAMEAIKQVDTSKNMDTQREIYKAKLRGDYLDLTGDKLEKASYDDPTGTVVSKGFNIPDSPAKTHKAGHKEEVDYDKRKEELLNQGFTQKDADEMIKSGAVTGKVGVESYEDRVKRLSKKYKKTPEEVKKILKSKEYKEGKKTM